MKSDSKKSQCYKCCGRFKFRGLSVVYLINFSKIGFNAIVLFIFTLVNYRELMVYLIPKNLKIHTILIYYFICCCIWFKDFSLNVHLTVLKIK